MKNPIAIFLIALIAWPLLLKVAVFVSWQANREYIAQNYCEKKDEPESGCEGNCHLAKQIAKTEEPATPFIPHKNIEKIELAVFDAGHMQELINAACTVNNTRYCSTSEFYIPRLFAQSIFQPPEIKGVS